MSAISFDGDQRRGLVDAGVGATATHAPNEGVGAGKESRSSAPASVDAPVQMAPATGSAASGGERAGDWAMGSGLTAAMGLDGAGLGGDAGFAAAGAGAGVVQRKSSEAPAWANGAASMSAAGGGDAGAVVQKKDPPAGAVAAAHAFAVPTVVDLRLIPDPVNRNQAINQSYHAIDAAMTGYLGDPLISNWFTYGQHASREAGTQIRNLQGGLQTLQDTLTILKSLTFFGLPTTVIGQARTAVRAITNITDLMGQEGMLKQAMKLALMRAGIGDFEMQLLTAEAAVALASPLLMLPFIGHLASMVARLIVAIPAIISSIEKIYKNMATGNRQIYENVAPAARAFLQAALAAPGGVPGPMAFAGDTSGFLAAAFAEYAECRKLGDEARAAPGTPAATNKLASRQQKAEHANLLVGMQEQLVILQPIFDTMMDELRAMSGTMVLHDPNGAHPLANNWGDFYTRMGIDPARAPADPRTITPGTLPPLLPASQRDGTISSYFGDNVTNEKIHEAPPGIAPMVQPKENGEGQKTDDVHAAAAHGIRGAAVALPFQAQIQRSFGRHDISGIKAHIDETARSGATAMGARAYAAGDHIAFAGTPDLHTAAHEAAHVVQQRAGVSVAGGVGKAGDPYEQNADAVADLVVAGLSAESLLGPVPGAPAAEEGKPSGAAAPGGASGAAGASGGSAAPAAAAEPAAAASPAAPTP